MHIFYLYVQIVTHQCFCFPNSQWGVTTYDNSLLRVLHAEANSKCATSNDLNNSPIRALSSSVMLLVSSKILSTWAAVGMSSSSIRFSNSCSFSLVWGHMDKPTLSLTIFQICQDLPPWDHGSYCLLVPLYCPIHCIWNFVPNVGA